LEFDWAWAAFRAWRNLAAAAACEGTRACKGVVIHLSKHKRTYGIQDVCIYTSEGRV
jgi:hypothetical protein